MNILNSAKMNPKDGDEFDVELIDPRQDCVVSMPLPNANGVCDFPKVTRLDSGYDT